MKFNHQGRCQRMSSITVAFCTCSLLSACLPNLLKHETFGCEMFLCQAVAAVWLQASVTLTAADLIVSCFRTCETPQVH